ncbi:hypothetical protein [Nitriliruptor alkaliphilus]|uniref:hypothetical protein n=1 Tax=Nitriliruptor alkaliphilus TaxID=427918 RepID=UPI000696D156|nr:hypothetical protein [Nitriliruptor alkaliphilus]
MTAVTDPSTEAGARHRSAYTWLTAFGIALIATSMAVLAVVFAATGSAQLGPAVTIVLVLVVVGVAAWRGSTWAKAVAIVVSLLLVLLFLPLVRGVTFPSSPLDFVPGLLLSVGVLLAAGGGVAAIRARRDLRLQPSLVERRIIQGVLATVLVAGTASTLVGLVSRTTVDPIEGDIAVDMLDFGFPDVIEAGVGDRLLVHNSDATIHDFAVAELGIDVLVLPGNDALIDLEGATPGTYVVYCTLHSVTSDPDPDSAGMATTLIVRG